MEKVLKTLAGLVACSMLCFSVALAVNQTRTSSPSRNRTQSSSPSPSVSPSSSPSPTATPSPSPSPTESPSPSSQPENESFFGRVKKFFRKETEEEKMDRIHQIRVNRQAMDIANMNGLNCALQCFQKAVEAGKDFNNPYSPIARNKTVCLDKCHENFEKDLENNGHREL